MCLNIVKSNSAYCCEETWLLSRNFLNGGSEEWQGAGENACLIGDNDYFRLLRINHTFGKSILISKISMNICGKVKFNVKLLS